MKGTKLTCTVQLTGAQRTGRVKIENAGGCVLDCVLDCVPVLPRQTVLFR